VPVYPKWPIVSLGPPDVAALVGVAGVIVLSLTVWRLLPRLVVFGAALFATNIVLVLGLVWNSYNRFAFVADRYLYLPGVGLAVAVVAGAYAAARAAGLPLRVPTGVLATWIAAVGIVTATQVAAWRDSGALWTWTLAQNPDCGPCHSNLGNFLAERDQLDAAVAHFERALAIEPDQKLLVSFGKARVRQGRLDDAVALYRRALRLPKEDAETYYALANALRRQNKTAEAIANYQRALELAPDSGDIHNNLGVALLEAERVDEARAAFERTLALHPGDVEAHLNLALIAEHAGDATAAIGHYRAALSGAGSDPDVAAAHRRFAELPWARSSETRRSPSTGARITCFPTIRTSRRPPHGARRRRPHGRSGPRAHRAVRRKPESAISRARSHGYAPRASTRLARRCGRGAARGEGVRAHGE
jgi:Flp pilus assembly protein TadD